MSSYKQIIGLSIMVLCFGMTMSLIGKGGHSSGHSGGVHHSSAGRDHRDGWGHHGRNWGHRGLLTSPGAIGYDYDDCYEDEYGNVICPDNINTTIYA